jgi:uncharacterized protein (TIGR03437 family)
MRSNLLLGLLATGLQFCLYAQSQLNQSPSRVVGQPSVTFTSASPNLVEGREVFGPVSVAIDRSSGTPALYVSDGGNHRVLVWRNLASRENGAPADFVIGQVNLVTTLPQGPGTARSGGLNTPSGIAVDAQGNLYVIDTGNNRIVRFRKPLEAASDEVPFPDLVIGQPTFSTDTPNIGGLVTAKTIAVSTAAGAVRSGIAFDAQGNLWFADSQNHRVLRYPASALAAGTNQPEADLVLGQPDLTSNVPAPTGNTTVDGVTVLAAMNKTQLNRPVGVTVDSEGRVYVADSIGRILVYAPPFFSGKEAVRVLGVIVQTPGQAPKLDTVLSTPQGLFAVGNRLGVADPGTHRIVIYDPASTWPAETAENPSPSFTTVIGQSGTAEIRSNRGLPEPTEGTLSGPFGAAWSGSELIVADAGNNRILRYPQAANGASANLVLGQTNFTFNSGNLIDGRELFLFNGLGGSGNVSTGSDGGGVVIDSRSNPPRMYIADTFNHRILGYADARRVRPGDRADLVIGQTDLNRSLVNSPSNNSGQLTDSGLFRPSGLAVDQNGDLFVADSGNGRVLRFPSPFEQQIPSGERRRANLVIGQPNFNQRITDPSSRNMAYPFGVALTVDGHLLVSDALHSRVLFFRRPANGQFTNGQAAERVIGQPDFFTVGPGSAQRRMNSPRHIATDTDERLYVADMGNNRILVYDRITVVENDPVPAFALTGVSAPQGVFVSALTGEIWVGNTRGNAATRYPRYERLAISQAPDYNIPSGTPLALTQDSSGNLYVAEGVNRIAIYYNALRHQIAGSYVERPLSPGTIAILYPAGAGVTFADSSRSFNELPNPLPLPTDLNDVAVLVNERPAPLYFVSPLQVNFLVPMDAPSSGDAEIQIVKRSTQQILAVGRLPFDRVSPALFVGDGSVEGQLAALNQDNTVNTADNPARVGQIVQLFGTGQGFVPNAPPDGTPPQGPTPTQEQAPSLRVVIGSDFVEPSDIQYSGLAPSLVGVWQINVRIPERVAPSAAVDVVVQVRSVNSNTPPAGFPRPRLRTTIAVRPAN